MSHENCFVLYDNLWDEVDYFLENVISYENNVIICDHKYFFSFNIYIQIYKILNDTITKKYNSMNTICPLTLFKMT